MLLCFLTLHFPHLNFPGALWPAGLGMALGFSVLAAAAWRHIISMVPLKPRWNPVDGKDGWLFKYVGYVLDPNQNLKMVTIPWKRGCFFCVCKWSCSGSIYIYIFFFFGGGWIYFSCSDSKLFFVQNYLFTVYFTRILVRWYQFSPYFI